VSAKDLHFVMDLNFPTFRSSYSSNLLKHAVMHGVCVGLVWSGLHFLWTFLQPCSGGQLLQLCDVTACSMIRFEMYLCSRVVGERACVCLCLFVCVCVCVCELVVFGRMIALRAALCALCVSMSRTLFSHVLPDIFVIDCLGHRCSIFIFEITACFTHRGR